MADDGTAATDEHNGTSHEEVTNDEGSVADAPEQTHEPEHHMERQAVSQTDEQDARGESERNVPHTEEESTAPEISSPHGDVEGENGTKVTEAEQQEPKGPEPSAERNESVGEREDEYESARATSDEQGGGLGGSGEVKGRLMTGQSYQREAFLRREEENELPIDELSLTYVLGFNASRRHNMAWLSRSILLMVSGNYVVCIDCDTKTQDHLGGLDGKGIGAIAVHPTERVFAVGEVGRNPNCYVYQQLTGSDISSASLMRVLRGGTGSSYTAIRFSPDGTRLATVGGSPDFWLTVWDWENECIVLRNKAFSQEVVDVAFSRQFEGKLVTCGVGHIKFWEMAQTFTGLKLQGHTGKFGNEEISDVTAQAELPDGNIISGTEYGRIHLWEAGLIKVAFYLPGGKPCHDGNIEVVQLDKESECILTAGVDGFIKYWSCQTIFEAEFAEDIESMEITPVSEHYLGDGVSIRDLLRADGHYIIHNARGSLCRVTLPDHRLEPFLSFHAGAITGLVACSMSNSFVTCGADGTVRVYDPSTGECTGLRSFAFAATCMVEVPGEKTRDVAVGFADGTFRVLRRCYDGVKLIHVTKPARTEIKSMAFSPSGTLMASVDSEGSAFFLDASRHFEPLGFVNLDCDPSSATWSPDGDDFLVASRNGGIWLVKPPQRPEKGIITYECSSTTQFQPFHRVYQESSNAPQSSERFPSVKSENQSQYQADVQQSQQRASQNHSEPSQAGEEGPSGYTEKDNSRGSTEGRLVQEDPFPVLGIQRGFDGSLWLCGGGQVSGSVFRCELSNLQPIEELKLHEKPVTFLSFAHGGNVMLSGSEDGSTRIEPLVGDYANLAWLRNIHGEKDGAVSAMAMSVDGSMLLSAGSDGTLLALRASAGLASLAHASRQEQLPALEIDPSSEVNDLPNDALSIEESKQKEVQDYYHRKAEERKKTVREQVEDLRRAFEQLVEENENLSQEVQLPREELKVDPHLEDFVREKNEEKVEKARKEVEPTLERSKRNLDKIRSIYLDPLEMERINLWSFAAGHKAFKCSSFRIGKIPGHMWTEIEEARTGSRSKFERSSRSSSRVYERSESYGGRFSQEGGQNVQQQFQQAGPSVAEGYDEKGLSKEEARRQKRIRREQEWQAFLATKPGDSYEGPEDVRAIQETKKNMGDFKLKSDPDYVAPEEERVNAERKRSQLLLLEQEVLKLKRNFNKKLLHLREVKKQIVREIHVKNERIHSINSELGQSDVGFGAFLLEEELIDENREAVTDAQLAEFEQELRKSGALDFPTTIVSDERVHTSYGGQGAQQEGPASPVPRKRRLVQIHNPAAFTQEDQRARHARLQFEKNELLSREKELLEAFDSALGKLREEKLRQEAGFKAADLKRILYLHELQILKECEKRDLTLKNKHDSKASEKEELDKRLEGLQARLETRYQEVERLNEAKKSIAQGFENLVDDDHPYREPLLKAFNRKIKRGKKEGAESDEEDEEDEEDVEESEEDVEEEEEEEEDVCPPGCDRNLWESVCNLRDRKLDQEEEIAEVNKSLESTKKEIETVQKKQKVAEGQLDGIEKEMEEFQREKQGKLNEVAMLVTLRLDQLERFEGRQLPLDQYLQEGLVFSRDSLERLKARIGELDDEKRQLQRQNKELNREHKNLQRSRNDKEHRMSELEKKAYNIQMLKFGQVIDLEKVDRMETPKAIEDLQQQLERIEVSQRKELEQFDQSIKDANTTVEELTRENTSLLNAISEETKEQRKLEQSVANNKGLLFRDAVQQRRQEVTERDNLVDKVNRQADEIDNLRREIEAIRTSGHSV